MDERQNRVGRSGAWAWQHAPCASLTVQPKHSAFEYRNKKHNFRCQLGDRYCQLGGQVTTGGGAPQVAPHLAQQGRHGKQLPRMPVPMPCRELGWSGSGSEDV